MQIVIMYTCNSHEYNRKNYFELHNVDHDTQFYFTFLHIIKYDD